MATKRFRQDHVTKLYKQCYRIKHEWEDILDTTTYEYLELISRANNCPITVLMAGLLPLTAAVCGPQSKVQVRTSFLSPLNTYAMTVCAPGGGKSFIYGIINEILEYVQSKTGVNILLETYSSAGLQRHQMENNGYALLCSDEGQRIIAQINTKQCKNEAERALLNKLWGGTGDKSALKDGARGFSCTSFSMAIFIQPASCFNEMSTMNSDDGFLDRIITFCSQPKHHTSQVNKTAWEKLSKCPEDMWKMLFTNILRFHETPIVYQFDIEAQKYYDDVADERIAEINALYPTDSDGENDEEITFSQSDCPSSSSKDIVILPRVAALLHILQSGINNTLDNINQPAKRVNRATRSQSTLSQASSPFSLPTSITKETLQAAEKMLVVCRQQKMTILEAVSGACVMDKSTLKSVDSLIKRVAKRVMMVPGPIVTPRDISRNLHLVDTAMAKEQLQALANKRNFGDYKAKGKDGWKSADIYFKPHPDTVSGEHELWDMTGISLEAFRAKYNDVSKITNSQTAMMKKFYQHWELLQEMFTQCDDSSDE